MAIVPRYEQQVELGNAPSVRQTAIATNTGLEGAVYGALAKAGEGLAKVGNNLFAMALKKQEEDNQAQFVKIKTDRDIYVYELLNKDKDLDPHQWNEIYPSFVKAIQEYDKDVISKLPNNALRKAFGNLQQITAPGFQKALISLADKKRADANSADYMDALTKRLNIGDYDGAIEIITAANNDTWSATTKQKMTAFVEGERNKAIYKATADKLFTPEMFDKYMATGDRKSVLKEIADTAKGNLELESYLTKEFEGRFADHRQAKNLRIEQQMNTVFKAFDEKKSYGETKKIIASCQDLDAQQRYRLNDMNEAIHEVGRHAPKRRGSGDGLIYTSGMFKGQNKLDVAMRKAEAKNMLNEIAFNCETVKEYDERAMGLYLAGLVTADYYVSTREKVGKAELPKGTKTPVNNIIKNGVKVGSGKEIPYEELTEIQEMIARESKKTGTPPTVVARKFMKSYEVKNTGVFFDDEYKRIELKRAEPELAKRDIYFNEQTGHFEKVRWNGNVPIRTPLDKKQMKYIKPVLEKYKVNTTEKGDIDYSLDDED